MHKKGLLVCIIIVIILIITLALGLGYILITNKSVSELESAIFDGPINHVQVSNLNELVIKDIVAKLKEDDNKLYIPVKKDDKYTYIDEHGNKLIDKEYDIATEFIKFNLNDNKTYALACVYKDGKKYVIQQDGSILFELKNPRDISNLEEDVKYTEVGNTLNDLINTTLSGNILTTTILNTNKDQTFASNITTTCKQIIKTNGKFDYNNDYYIEEEETSNNTFEAYAKNPRLYDTYDKYLKAKDKKIVNHNYYLVSKKDETNKIKLDCEDLFIKNDILYIYDNGNIPFISVSTNESGWFDSTGRKTTLPSATMRIVQLKNDAIIVVEPIKISLNYVKKGISQEEFARMKTSSDTTDTSSNEDIYSIYALAMNGTQKTSKDYKILYITNDGYVLKNLKTNKYYVADSNFKLIYKDGFDLITPYLLDKGYLICGTKQDDSNDETFKAPKNYKYKIYDFKGNELTSDEYDEVYSTISINTLNTSFENLLISNCAVMQLNENIKNKLLYRNLFVDKLDENNQSNQNNQNNQNNENNENNN